MRDRIRLFKSEFYQYSELPDQSVRELIRLHDNNVNIMQQRHSNPALGVIGGLIVWGAGLFFTASAGLDINKTSETNDPIAIIINSLIASSASAISYVLMDIFLLEKSEGKKLLPEPLPAINAALCGIFAISAGCNSLTNTAALIVGIFSAMFFVLA
jgi:ammonia channel protein AmtB